MKKNRTMRIAAVMLVFALLTTCIISGTFAKYITTGDAGTHTARVAKWGVEIEGTGTTFAKNYLANIGASGNTGTNDTDGITVKSSTDECVVAPGTKGTLASFNVTGTPEVSATITYSAEITFTGWTAATCPIVFKVNGENKTAAQVVGAINDCSATFNVDSTDATFATVMSGGLSVDWEWPYYVDSAGDAADTSFGNAETAPTISITITATITQKD